MTSLNEYESEFDAGDFQFCKVINHFKLDVVKSSSRMLGLHDTHLMFLTIDGIRYKVNSMETNYHTKVRRPHGMKEGYNFSRINEDYDRVPTLIQVDGIPEGYYTKHNGRWTFVGDRQWLEENELR